MRGLPRFREWSRERKAITIIAVVGFAIGLLVGPVSAKFAGGGSDPTAASKPGGAAHTSSTSITDVPRALIAYGQSAIKKACNPQYDYPGCTAEQVRALEADSRPDVKKNFGKTRWGQSGNEWDRLSDDSLDKLRRKYEQAVDNYVARKHAMGIHGKRAQPLYPTWGGFKSHTSCAGSFVLSPSLGVWCTIKGDDDETVQKLDKIAIRCEGAALAAGATAGVAALFTGVAAPPAAVAAGTTVGAGCLVQEMWNMIWDASKSARTALYQPV